MTTSGDKSFTMTRNEIIRQALLLCNAIEENEAVSVTAQNDASVMLNMFVKQINTRRPLWATLDYTIPLYDRKRSYTIGPGGNKNVNRPLKLTQARRIVAGGTTETPIFQLSRKGYMELPVKDTQSPVNQFYYDPQLDLGVLYVWGVSNVLSTSLEASKWSASGDTYIYGESLSSAPKYVFENGTELTEVATVAGLSPGTWTYEFATLSIQPLLSTTDPSAESDGYIKTLFSTPDRIIVTAHRTLDDFDDPDDTPDFPQEALLMLTWNLAYLIAPQYAPNRIGILKPLADEYKNSYLEHDTEPVSFRIQPANQENFG